MGPKLSRTGATSATTDSVLDWHVRVVILETGPGATIQMHAPTFVLLVLALSFAQPMPASEPGQRDVAGHCDADGLRVADWNRHLLETAEAEDRFLTLKGVRTAAMMHLAMHDALNAIEPRFERYLPVREDPAGPADARVAMAHAAFIVTTTAYPDQADRFAALRQTALGTTSGAALDNGLRLGRTAAESIIEARHDDRWNAEADYEWHAMAPGVYAEFNEHSGTPEGFVFGAGWAAARPFALSAPDQFRSPPPPPIDAPEYTAAFNEVKELGATHSATRTDDQAHLAMWWKDFVENSHNRLARRLVENDCLDAWDSARLFALLNMAIYDAYVNVFDNKFHYNHWRPYTAIRWADNDGNPDTVADPGWDNLHRHTYAFPSYPSAHGTACASAMTVMADTFGAERPVTLVTERVDRAGPLSDKIPMRPSSRSFDSFSAAARECSLSRVYLGIHFRYDSTEGTALGSRIGTHVVSKFLRPR